MRKTARKPPPPRRSKGGPLRSKKPGRNQIPRVRTTKALKPRAPADVAPVAQRAPETSDPARPRAVDVARAALDKKAEDVLVLDVRGLTSYADYFVLATADSDRQAGAIADHVDQKLKEQGASKVGVEGYESGRWILIDYGDVVAHVFNREARGFYDLEGLWADAPRFRIDG
jgi:ribosome-associated protein